MCDRHKEKPLDHYCLEHETLVCAQCATESHAQSPCESMPLVAASKHIQAKLDIGVSELKQLKGVSQAILDGKRQDDTLNTIQEAEALLDSYIAEIKSKFQSAKSMLKPFTELSREERWKLKAVATKRIPNGPKSMGEDFQDARDLSTRLQEVRKQAKAAKEALNSLPNYVEVSINPEFINALKFDGKPVIVTRKGQETDSGDEMDDSKSSTTVGQETVYLVEKSYFSLEHCTDIVMFEDFIVCSVGNSIQKRDRKRMSFRQALTLEGAGKLCILGETTEVSVLQNGRFITIIETVPDLTILYKLMIDKHYFDISYLECTLGSGYNCPEQNPVFAVCHSQQEAFLSDFVDLIQAKPTRYPGRLPSYNIDSRTIAESQFGRNKSRFRGARSVCAFQSRNIVVGALKGVTCVAKTGVLIWTIDIYKPIVQVMAFRTLVFVCVKDERKLMTIGKEGHVISENILPPIDLYPQKLSALNDILMVKHADRFRWIIFKKMYEPMENSG